MADGEERVYSYRCPACDADPGEFCRVGLEYIATPHVSRSELARGFGRRWTIANEGGPCARCGAIIIGHLCPDCGLRFETT